MISSVESFVNALAMLLSSMACLANALAALISSVACLVNALAALICSVALLLEALARMPGDLMAIIADLKAQAQAQAQADAESAPAPASASACATQKTHTYLLLPPSEESTTKPDDPAALLDASAMTAATTTAISESPKRRCVVVMSTYAHIRMEAVAAKRWIIDGLKNLGVRVTELELDAVEHHVLFKKYRSLSNSTQYPLVFLEDEKTGRNRTFLDHSRIEQHIYNIGMTEQQLDEAHVPDAHRPGHVYRDAVKFKHAIIQPPNPYWNVRMEGRFEERERANDRADQAAEAAEAALMAMEDHSA